MSSLCVHRLVPVRCVLLSCVPFLVASTATVDAEENLSTPSVSQGTASQTSSASTIQQGAVLNQSSGVDSAELLRNHGSATVGGSSRKAAGICDLNPPCEGTAEGEACLMDDAVDDTNGGCNSTPPVFGSAACGETICGMSSNYLDAGTDSRDTDWYLISHPGGDLTATLTSEFTGVAFILDGIATCTPAVVGDVGCSDNCSPIADAAATVLPGDYVVFVSTGNCDGTGVFTGFPCGTANDYQLSIACGGDINPACTEGAGDCYDAGGNGSPGCDDILCCDAICDTDPFCCDTEWDSGCAGTANDGTVPECVPPPPTCDFPDPPDAMEPEPCGDDTNGGCNSTPPAFTESECGVTWQGTAWNDGATRDTDWYLVTHGGGTITGTLTSGFEGVAFIIDGVAACAPAVVGQIGCSSDCVATMPATADGLPAGQYVVFVSTGLCDGTGVFEGAPCGSGNDYQLAIECVPLVINPACTPDAGSCYDPAGNGSPGCDDELCCDAVCDSDDFCCSVEWDVGCAAAANGGTFPACVPPPPPYMCTEDETSPENDCCNGETTDPTVVTLSPGGTVFVPYDTTNAKTDGPADPDDDGDGVGDFCNSANSDLQTHKDVWFVMEIPTDGVLTASVCFDPNGFDSKIAGYEATGLSEFCCEDVNMDFEVGIEDLLALLAAWGTNPGGSPDCNGDGDVGIEDLLSLLAAWGPCPLGPGGGGLDNLDCDNLIPIRCNEDCEADAPFRSELPLVVTAGQTIVIRLGGFSANGMDDMAEFGSGEISFNLSGCDLPPPGDNEEPEACGEDVNGGCNATPVSFTNAPCGESWSGTAWADGGSRDTDWYLVDHAGGIVSGALTSEFEGVTFIIDGIPTCTPTIVGEVGCSDGGCAFGDASADLPAGQYVVFVSVGTCDGGAIFEGYPCGADNNYVLEVGCTQAECTVDGVCDEDAGENAGNCPDDCFCGNGSCEATESCVDCETDCGACPDCSICPGGGIDEGEACGDDTNGGCNSTPTAFGAAACGDTLCGTGWADGASRDTDWYLVSHPGGILSTSAQSEFPSALFIIDGIASCAPVVVGSTGCSNNCLPLVDASADLPAGDYVAFIGAGDCSGGGVFEGFPCGSQNAYIMTVTCTAN